MESLSSERSIFHSEADFQFALAWKIKTLMPTAEIRLEYPPPDNPNKYIDILVKNGEFVYPIELKYPTKKCVISVNNEVFNLKEHGAQDIQRYDFIKDICRIESFSNSISGFKNGVVIWLTNDPHYWNPPKSDKVGYAEFVVHEGVELKGILSWKEHMGVGTTKGRDPLKLNGVYLTKWHDYSSLEVPNGLFRYAVHIV
jgi:hypothetical protein